MLAEFTMADEDKLAKFFVAASAGQTAKVKAILDAGVPVNVRDDSQRTLQMALHKAAANGHLTTVRLLVTKGAEIDAMDNYGNTPLVLAIYNDHVDVIAFLKAKGANIDIVDVEPADPRAREKISYSNVNALYRAVKAFDAEKVALLQSHGANINGSPSFIPLHYAIRTSNIYYDDPTANWAAMFEILRAAGANVDIENSSGRTALELATERGAIDVMQSLIAAGANVEKFTGSRFLTPLYYAVTHLRHYVAVDTLLNAGALINENMLFQNIAYFVHSDNIHLLLLLLKATEKLDRHLHRRYLSQFATYLLIAIKSAISYANSHKYDPIHGKAITAIFSTAMAVGAEIPDDPCIVEPRIFPVLVEAARKTGNSSLALSQLNRVIAVHILKSEIREGLSLSI